MATGTLPALSVIIPCRGHAREVEACLGSVIAQQPPFPYEVIVVDSASDPAVTRTVERFPSVILVRGDHSLLAGEARDLGARHAQAPRLAFLDADCLAEPGWLEAAHAVTQNSAVRLAGGPVLDNPGLGWIAAADNRLQFADVSPGRSGGPARYFPGCNLAMRTEDYLASGGFPAGGAFGGEDMLFCELVLRRWPESLRFEPRLRVRHAGRHRWGEYLRHQERFGYTRAIFGLHLRAWHLRLGRYRVMLPVVTLKRLSYLLKSGVRHGGIGKTLVLLPVLLPGLLSYARGFGRGCRDARGK